MKLPLSIALLQRFAPVALVIFSSVIAVTAYLQALDYQFFSDDVTYVIDNPKLAGLHLTELWRLFTEPYNNFEFLPLRDLSYWLDITLFGLAPSPFRIHNIILYLFCLPLVYGTTLGIWRYFRPWDAASAPWAAAAVTTLFTLHPAHVEMVVWVSGRKDVLAGIFSMLTLWIAVSARREKGLSVPHAIAALGAFVAVMLSKASYVAVAPITALLWLVFWFDIPEPYRRRSLLLWPLAMLSLAAFLALIFTASSTVKGPTNFGAEMITQSLAVLGRLASIAITPGTRHFFYPVTEHPYVIGMVVLGVAVLVAAAAGGVMSLRKRSLEGFALLAFLLLCIPYMQLIPFRTFILVQDRYVSLAVWPVLLLVVSLSWRLEPVPRTILLLLISLPWSFQTMERPRDWRSNEAMLDADLRAYPGYYLPAVYKVIQVQVPQGLNHDAVKTANSITDPEIRNITIRIIVADAARAHALNTGNPHNATALLVELGQVLKQRTDQIVLDSPMRYVWESGGYLLAKEWESLAKHFPDDAVVRYNTGLWMMNTPIFKEMAITHLRAATELQGLPESDRGIAFYNFGLALLNSGYVADAEVPLRTSLEQSQPDLRAYCPLSKVYKQNGRLEDAARTEAECHKQVTSRP